MCSYYDCFFLKNDDSNEIWLHILCTFFLVGFAFGHFSAFCFDLTLDLAAKAPECYISLDQFLNCTLKVFRERRFRQRRWLLLYTSLWLTQHVCLAFFKKSKVCTMFMVLKSFEWLDKPKFSWWNEKKNLFGWKH